MSHPNHCHTDMQLIPLEITPRQLGKKPVGGQEKKPRQLGEKAGGGQEKNPRLSLARAAQGQGQRARVRSQKTHTQRNKC